MKRVGLIFISLLLLASGCTTGAMWEDTAPSNVTSSYEDGATDVTPDAVFTITFVKAVNTSTVTNSTFFLVEVGVQGSTSPNPSLQRRGKSFDSSICDPANAISGSVICSSETQCSFVPDSQLDSEASYTLCLTDEIFYEDGNRYPGYQMTFTTADVISPEISSTTPAADATNIAVNTSVQAVFSEEMEAPSIDTTTFTLSSGSASVDGAVSYNADTKTATFTPSSNLSSFQQYTATIASSAQDEAGNTLGSDYSWSFTTSDIIAPTVTSVSPADGETGVSIDTLISAVFSEAMDSSTIATDTFTLSNSTAGTVSYTDATKTATFDPTSDLSYNTTYAATITVGTKDSHDVPLASDYSWSFTTVDVTGILDTSFNGVGYVVHNNAAGGNGADYGWPITTDSSGRILVAYFSTNAGGNADMVIWRYNADGTPDTSFDSDGIVIHNNAAGGNGTDYGLWLTTDSSGRILVVGSSRNGAGNDDMVIWRYNADGTLDTSFDGDGIVVHNSAAGGNAGDYGYSVMTDSSGRILVAGYSRNASANNDMVIWRYNADGTLDTSFDGDGIVTHNNAAGGNSHDAGYSIAIDSAGRILVVGYSRNASANADMAIWRYNSNGTLDTSFDGDGYAVHNSAAGGNGHDYGWSVKTDSSGRILVAGYSVNASANNDMVIWRYNADGTPDTSFDGDGVVVHNNAAGGNGPDACYSLAIDSSGRIVVVGNSRNASGNDDMAIWRYNEDGTLDTSFDGDGIVVHNSAAGGNGADNGWGMTIDSLGRILVAGYSNNGTNADMTIWRYR